MKRILAAVAAASLLGVATPASADSVELLYTSADSGFLCGFTSYGPSTSSAHVGEIHGGPYVAGNLSASVILTCTIQVNAASHSGPNSTGASTSGTGVVVLSPTAITYFRPEAADVYLCSQLTINGTTYYWDDTNGGFTTNSGAGCALAISADVPDTGSVVVPQCRDGADNDGDGWYDTADSDCSSPDDPYEGNIPQPGPGGAAPPGSPSYHCDGGQQVHDGTVGGVLFRLYVIQPSATQADVCFRIGGTGGKVAVTPTAPGSPGVPSTDTNSAACATTNPPNQAPGPHPIADASLAGTPYYLDVWSDGGQVWVCARVGTTVNTRVVVPITLPNLTPGTQVTYYPDPA